ncbi:hypothetical protein NKG05_10165 [Oerskovia sp. M15]
MTAVLLVVASAPVGASLASLSRWWVWSAPNAALTLALAVATVLVALLSWTVSRLLPRRPWTLPASLAGVTWLVLTIDGATGTTLQQASLLGTSAVVNFTRFYGFNNVTFAIYAVAGIVLAGASRALPSPAGVDGSRPRSSRRSGSSRSSSTAGPGSARTWAGSWHSCGVRGPGTPGREDTPDAAACRGGRRRHGPRRRGDRRDRLALPSGSSHLGGFVQSLLDGGAFEVIARKAAGAWTTVANPAGAVATVLVIALSVVLLRPERWRLPEVAEAYRTWPLLKPTAIALVVVAGVGSCLNDSGIIIGIMVLVVGPR